MPSIISQLRSGNQSYPQPQFQIDENYLNQLRTVLHSNNSSELLANMAANNPQIKQLMQIAQNGGNLKLIYEQMARQVNVDPNWLINKLMR